MIELFFSYSHRDEDLRDELEIHLAMLRRQGLIRTWHDRRIPPGEEIHGQISEHLESSDVILLLVSPYFLASDYCYDVEMKRALERHDEGGAIVIPVILEPCEWQEAPFGNLRATPKDGKPISKFPNIHDAFLDVAKDIRWAAGELGKGEKGPTLAEPEGGAMRQPGIRSSNLRVKKQFSDHERDRFIDESFTYIAAFFENSLHELSERNPEIETRFMRSGDSDFVAAVYVDGEKRTSCRIWTPRQRTFGGDIAYSASDTGGSSSFNDSMQVEEDGFQLGFKPLGLGLFGQRSEELLTPHGAAEYFWSVLIGPLQ